MQCSTRLVRRLAILLGVVVALPTALTQGAPLPPPDGPPGVVAPRSAPLVACDGGEFACVKVKPEPADIVGVWRAYFGHPIIQAPNGMAYMRFTADGRYIMADTKERTAQSSPPYPSGRFTLEDGILTYVQTEEVTFEACVTGRYEVGVYYFGDRPVALVHRLVEDACPGRPIDTSSPMLWVSD